ncbi:type II toxin-antitoxin system RelE/ParE family toxin [Salegentibacter sp. HM20]
MDSKFEIVFLEEAIEFLNEQEPKVRKKIFYNLDKARYINDPKIFKKLTEEIWEFRVKFNRLQYRLFAFWDKKDNSNTLVISTHGIIKKTGKVPKSEIEKAKKIRSGYFNY